MLAPWTDTDRHCQLRGCFFFEVTHTTRPCHLDTLNFPRGNRKHSCTDRKKLDEGFIEKTTLLHLPVTICTRAAVQPRTTACFLVLSSVVFERGHGKFDGRDMRRRAFAARSSSL
jgi:hypothetical protein